MLKRFLFFLSYPVVRFLYPTIMVGKKNIKGLKGATIVASNHLSLVDVVLLSTLMVRYNFYYLAKKELKPKNRIARWFFSLMNVIYVDRAAMDISTVREVGSVLNNGNKLMIFPEGTRNKGNEENLQQMKGGVVFFASRSDATIVPVQIIHKPKLFVFNRVVVGEPYKVADKTKEGRSKEVEILEDKFKALRKPYDEKMELKRKKKEEKYGRRNKR